MIEVDLDGLVVGAGGGGALGDGADGTWLVPGDTAAFFHSVGRAPVDRHELKQMRMHALTPVFSARE